MKRISSRDNTLLKALRKLAQASQGRKRGGVAVLEGLHLCATYLESVGQPRHAVFDAGRLDHPEHCHPELLRLQQGVELDLQVWLEGRLIQDLESVPAGQGVVFVIETPAPAVPERLDGSSVWLDRIQDPGNVGSILRSCAAAGVQQVFLSDTTAFAWSPKVVRSGQGAHFALQIHEQVDLLDLARRLDVPLVVTTLEQSCNLYQTALPAACAWVFGHEGQGVAPALQALADVRLRIPQEPAAESLNVAAAAAVCLFEHRRQRLFSPPG